MLVQQLRAIQDRCGYLPETELRALAAETKTPLYRIQELISFFPHFRSEWERPPYVQVQVCRDMACHLRGAPELTAKLKKLEREGDHPVVVEGVSCLGRCDRAIACTVSRWEHTIDPAQFANARATRSFTQMNTGPKTVAHFHDAVFAGHSIGEMVRLVEHIVSGESPDPDHDIENEIDRSEWQVDPYAKLPSPNYEAVRRFVEAHPLPIKPPPRRDVPDPPPRPSGVPYSPAEIKDYKADERNKASADYIAKRHPMLKIIENSRLKGMGGAGIPASTKWRDVWLARSDAKYIICNGDESEPGTFKDRELLLRTPHLVVEGVILAGLMTGATEGFIYIRHEYEEQIEAVRAEIERAKKMGACGDRIFESPWRFPVQVFVSPGGYVCGEESALIEAMEDKRAQPRNKPPEVMANGYRDKPTVVNNVETLAWAPAILLNALRRGDGLDSGTRLTSTGLTDPGLTPKKAEDPTAETWFSKAGARGGEGRRFFSLCGDVEKPGVFEVPSGTTMLELITKAGGMRGGKKLKAIAFSGPSGGLMPATMPLPKRFQDRVENLFAERLLSVQNDQQKIIDKHEKHYGSAPVPEKVAAKHKDAVEGVLKRVQKEIAAMRALIDEIIPNRDAEVVELARLPLDKKLLGDLRKYLGFDVMLGAGLAVYAEPFDPLDHAVRYTEFFRNESCGKCVPCRIGSQKLVEIGTSVHERVKSGRIALEEVRYIREQVKDLHATLKITSICGLGRAAGNPLATALQYFETDLAGG